MKIIFDIEKEIEEDTIHIRCKGLSDEILEIQKQIENILSKSKEIIVYKDDTEYYIKLDKVLFFETSDKDIILHTTDNIFTVKSKLYELQEILPDNFIRISKSTILNVSKVYAIQKNGFSNGMIEFLNTHKQVSVSRSYYKAFKLKMNNRRQL